jgi:ABC-type uncharacterized transport system involved in gliding motility auxiliary subunit
MGKESIMIKLGRVLGIVGFVSLLSVPLTLFLWDWEFTWTAFAKLLFGIAAISFWLGTNFTKVRETFQGRSTFYGGFAALFIVMALVAVVIVNYVFHKHPYWIDMTKEKIFSLSDHSRKAVLALEEDTRVTAFYGPREPEYEEVRGWLERYRYASERFTYELVDPVVRQDLVQKFNIHQGGPRIVIRYRDREERVRLDDPDRSGLEESITTALLELTVAGEKRKICFFTGHGEKARKGSDPLGVISLFEQDLHSEGYLTDSVSLLEQPKVPDICQLAILVGPKKDLTAAELKSLKDHLRAGGKLAAFLGSGDSDSLNPLLQEFGIVVGDNTIINPESRSPFNAVSDPMVYPANHPVFSSFFQEGVVMLNQLQAVFPVARSVKISAGPPEDLEVVELVHSSSNAWAETDPLKEDVQVVFTKGKDQKGPVPMAVTAELKAPGETGLRLAVFGSSFLVSDAAYRAFAFNRDLVMNTIAWLVHEEKKIAIRPRLRAASQIMLDESQLKFITFFSTDILPLLILALGITVWQLRRWS